MNCNMCGKEFEENQMLLKKAEDGTEYYICKQCENNGVALTETKPYFICSQCGYPHQKDEFKGVCKFCESKDDFKELALTAVEEELLDDEPQKLYREKLGDDAAKKIADWIESPQREAVGRRHKRDRLIDTSSLIGLIIGYIMLETNLNNYSTQKPLSLFLIIVTVLTIVACPLFKKLDRKKERPIWLTYVILALLVDAYVVLVNIFA